MKQKVAVMNARNEGETQAVKRILSALPFSPQSWSESPYFDKSLYNYDEKVISSTERPKQCADHPIKFYSRSDDQVQFKITPGLPDKQDRSKKYASYIFHPFQPFIISVQHVLFQPPIVNFHFRHQRD
jgi:de-etiolated-1